MARRSALTDSSSLPPSHCLPPIPQAPYPISLTSKFVLPSLRYLILLNVNGNAVGARRRADLEHYRDRAGGESGRDLRVHLDDAGDESLGGPGILRLHR